MWPFKVASSFFIPIQRNAAVLICLLIRANKYIFHNLLSKLDSVNILFSIYRASWIR